MLHSPTVDLPPLLVPGGVLMLTRIWKEDAEGRMIPGSLRVVDARLIGDNGRWRLDPAPSLNEKTIPQPTVKRVRPIYLVWNRRKKK